MPSSAIRLNTVLALVLACMAEASAAAVVVTSVDMLPDGGRSVTVRPTSIVLGLSSPVDPLVLAVTAMRLVGSAGDGVFDDGNDVEIDPTAVTVADDGAVVIDLSGVALPDDRYRIRLSSPVLVGTGTGSWLTVEEGVPFAFTLETARAGTGAAPAPAPAIGRPSADLTSTVASKLTNPSGFPTPLVPRGASPKPVDEAAWGPLGSGIGANGRVFGVLAVGSDVYISGEFTTIDGVAASGIARWDGHAWHALGSGLTGGAGGDDLVWFNGALHVIGKFTAAGGVPAVNVARWDGASWSALGSGIPDYPYAATVHAGSLYVGGGSPEWVRSWDGTAWTVVGQGTGGYVYCLASYGSLLAVGGGISTFETISTPYIAIWDGTTWSTLAGGVDGTVAGLMSTGTDLYACGAFGTAGAVPAKGIARWDGAAWHGMGAGLDGSGAHAMLARRRGLYACGTFTHAGGGEANRAAAWDGSVWTALGSGTDDEIFAIAPVSGGFVAVGQFHNAGGVPAVGVARFRSPATGSGDGRCAVGGMFGFLMIMLVAAGSLRPYTPR
jgi:hypothetical protein